MKLMLTEYEKNFLKHRKLVIFLFFIGIALLFWPASLYGNSDYILLLGKSMWPTIQPGSLVIVKSHLAYNSGEIIAFTDSAGIQIVHRIIEINDGVFVTQGDNNSFKDSPITYDEIVGKAEIVIPYMGFVGLFLQTPIGLAIIAVLMIIAFIPKSKSKVKKPAKINSLKIVKMVLVLNGIHYIIEQIAVTMNLQAFIPLTEYFQPAFASTLMFAGWTTVFIMIAIITKKVESEKSNDTNPLKIIILVSCILVIGLKIMLMIPVIVNLVSLL